MTLAVTHSSGQTASSRPDIRVMVVDDSVVARGLMARWIEAEPDLHVCASLRNGREAVDQIVRVDPDVVILDIEMPELDGLAALPMLLARKRDLVVIMASALTRRHAEASIRALSLGAADYIPKPETRGNEELRAGFRRDLVEKIRQLAGRRRKATVESPPLVPQNHRAFDYGMVDDTPPARPMPAFVPATLPKFSLRAAPMMPPRVLLIGSSTGGPQALATLLGSLGSVIDQAPVLITQHMPPTFTTILSEHLAKASGRLANEAADGMPVRAGQIYLARGGRHMTVQRRDGNAVLTIGDGPPVNFCKPAVDPLFLSAAEVWGSWTLATVLTGMGSDGLRGAAEIVKAGGGVLAQDEATSVVWGMPGAVAQAGLCFDVLPLDQLAGRITRHFGGGHDPR